MITYSIATLPADLNSLKKVAESSFSTTVDSTLDEWFSFEQMYEYVQERRGVCIKATDELNQMVGMTYGQQENPINGKEGLEKWVVVIVAVAQAHSGKGIGSGLLAHFEKEAKKNGAIKLFVYANKDSDVISFYKKNGYSDAGYIKDYQYGESNSATFLLKYL